MNAPRNHLVKHVMTRGGAGKHRDKKREQKVKPPKEVL